MNLINSNLLWKFWGHKRRKILVIWLRQTCSWCCWCCCWWWCSWASWSSRAVVWTPAVHCSQVSCHVVLPVELLMTHLARVGVPVQVGGDVVPVEVAWVGVRVVAHLAAVRVPVLDAEASDRDWRCRVCGPCQQTLRRSLCIQACQFGFNLLLHLVAHQVGRWAGRRACLWVDWAAIGWVQPFKRRFWVDRGKRGVAVLPVRFGLVCGSRGGTLGNVVLLLDMHPLLHLLGQELVLSLDPEHPTVNAVTWVPRIPAVPVRLLHRQVQDRGSSLGNIVVTWHQGGNPT